MNADKTHLIWLGTVAN